MTLPSSGPLSFIQINGELNRDANTANSSLNESAARSLAGVSSGAISINNFYGKTQPGWNLKNGGLNNCCQPAYSPELNLWVFGDNQAYIYTTPNLAINSSASYFSFYQPATASSIASAVWGAGRFVVAAGVGYYYHSTNGINWTEATFPSSNNVRTVIFANSLFVAVGASGLIMTSSDGVNWTIRTSGTAVLLNDISYLNGQFYVVGQSQVILRSSDGITWTSVGPTGTISLQQITYSGSLFVAVGTQQAAINYCYSTTGDAGTWTLGRINDSGGFSIFGTTSASGVIWTGSQFVVTGTGGVTATSSNGTTWTLIDKGASYAGSYKSVGGRIFNFTIGSNSVFLLELSGSTHQNVLVISQSGTASFNKQGAYSNTLNLFVVPSASGTVLTSSDGLTWTSRRLASTSNTATIGFPGSISLLNNGTFALACNTNIFTSSDGINWTLNASIAGAVGLAQIAWASGIGWVVCGAGGSIRTSPDLTTWTSRTSGVGQQLVFIVHNGTRFVSIGLNGTAIYSTDGVTWTTASLLGVTSAPTSLMWTGSQFIANFTNQEILTSSDGITWSIAATFTGVQKGVFFNGLQYYGAEVYANIRRSPNATSSWALEFTYGGTIGYVFPSFTGGTGGKGIGVLFGDTGMIYAKVPTSFESVAGTVAPTLGSGGTSPWTLPGWISVQNVNADDAFQAIPLPFTFQIAGTNYTTAFIGSNTYITFGAGSTTFSNLSATNPGLPKFFLGAADNSYQRVSYYTAGTDYVTIRYEGNGSTSGTLGSPGIVLEITFFNPAKTSNNNVVQVLIGAHNRTTGLFGVASANAYYATLLTGAWTANQSYVFTGNSAGTSWTISSANYVRPN